MKAFALVAAGGAVGAVARYTVYLLTVYFLGTRFPYATVFVNVAGSFAMGLLIEGMTLAGVVSTEVRLFFAVGMLGAFTTFSTFSLDFAILYKQGEWGLSALYALASVFLSIGALFAGLALARRVFG